MSRRQSKNGENVREKLKTILFLEQTSSSEIMQGIGVKS